MLADALLAWYRANRRPLPWRRNQDPYAVWVSEIMLQQTTVAAVVPYFERWMERFPNVETLALSDEQEVLALWQGLGYYRRCRNLLASARWVVENGWPESAKAWLAVPGVGRYTAGAIASIALGEAVPVVDGNVERVYARLIADNATGALLTRNAWDWATARVHEATPGDWNQALMELGATICRPVAPACGSCPVADYCLGLKLGKLAHLPAPTVKREIIKLTFHVWIPVYQDFFGVRQIPTGEWWEGMWEFPRYAESGQPAGLKGVITDSLSLKHTVTHHRIVLRASVVAVEWQSPELVWRSAEELEVLPMPAPQRRLAEFAAQLPPTTRSL